MVRYESTPNLISANQIVINNPLLFYVLPKYSRVVGNPFKFANSKNDNEQTQNVSVNDISNCDARTEIKHKRKMNRIQSQAISRNNSPDSVLRYSSGLMKKLSKASNAHEKLRKL